MRGLPYATSKTDIQRFFSSYNYVKDSIKIEENMDGRRTGYATLLFTSESDASSAVNEKQGDYIKNRWIELFLRDYSYYK